MVDARIRSHAVDAAERLRQALMAGHAYTLPTPDRRALVHQMLSAVGPETPWRLARALRAVAAATRAEADAEARRDPPLCVALRGYAAECDRIAQHLQTEGDTWPR